MLSKTRLIPTIAVWMLFLLGAGGEVGAWSGVGHRVVCEIAYQELTDDSDRDDDARDQVNALMKHVGKSFADSCTWADEDKQKKARRPDHFINVPRYYYEVRTGQCRLGDRCLFSAIRHDADVLSYSSSTQERAEALMYLGHWVGDIHQPLHVSYADDLGGNDIEQSGEVCDYGLHSVWDYCIIKKKLGSKHSTIAAELRAEVEDTERVEWADSTVIDWADESYTIARREAVGYCEKKGNQCWYDEDSQRLEEGDYLKVVTIDDDYLEDFAPVVRQRLQMAGIRLGALLNRLLDPPEWEEQIEETEESEAMAELQD